MRIFVAGGQSVLGKAVVQSLLRLGCGVRVVLPRGARRGLLGYERLQTVLGDIERPGAWLEDLRHFDVIVHLPDTQRTELDQVLAYKMTRSMLDAARRPGSRVKRYVLLSQLGASAGSPFANLRAAWESEELIRASEWEHVILRTGRIWHPGERPGYRAFWMMRLLGRIPVVGLPDERIQPVAMANVVEGVVKGARVPLSTSSTYPVAGPRVYTLQEWMNLITRQIGGPNLTPWYLADDATAAKWMPFARRLAPRWLTGQVCNPIRYYRDLCIRPIMIDDDQLARVHTPAERRTGPAFR